MNKKHQNKPDDPFEIGPAIICQVTTPEGEIIRLDTSSGYKFSIKFLPKMFEEDKGEHQFCNLEHLLKFMYGRGYIVGKYTKKDGSIDIRKLLKHQGG